MMFLALVCFKGQNQVCDTEFTSAAGKHDTTAYFLYKAFAAYLIDRQE